MEAALKLGSNILPKVGKRVSFTTGSVQTMAAVLKLGSGILSKGVKRVNLATGLVQTRWRLLSSWALTSFQRWVK